MLLEGNLPHIAAIRWWHLVIPSCKTLVDAPEQGDHEAVERPRREPPAGLRARQLTPRRCTNKELAARQPFVQQLPQQMPAQLICYAITMASVQLWLYTMTCTPHSLSKGAPQQALCAQNPGALENIHIMHSRVAEASMQRHGRATESV